MRIMVTGSRNWTDRSPVMWALDQFKHHFPVTLVHGGARGADRIAHELAREREMATEVWLPEYDKYPGYIAPLKRNDAMLDSKIDYVLAFMLGTPEKGGTLYTVNGAKERGIPVIIYNWPGDPNFK